jgi:hypothetical protein
MDREAQPVVGPPLALDQLPVRVVQEEEPLQLRTGRRSAKRRVTSGLLIRQKLDRHSRTSRHLINKDCRRFRCHRSPGQSLPERHQGLAPLFAPMFLNPRDCAEFSPSEDPSGRTRRSECLESWFRGSGSL